MENIKTVLMFSYGLLQTELHFAPFSFTIWQFMLAVLVLSIVVDFVLYMINR